MNKSNVVGGTFFVIVTSTSRWVNEKVVMRDLPLNTQTHLKAHSDMQFFVKKLRQTSIISIIINYYIK